MTAIDQDTVVSVHYTGTFPDSGEEFDSSRDGDPITFLVGHQGMIPGFEREIMGASVGDTFSIRLSTSSHSGDSPLIRKGLPILSAAIHGSSHRSIFDQKGTISCSMG